MRPAAALAALCCLAALAGCLSGPSAPAGPQHAFTVAVAGLPATTAPLSKFNLTVTFSATGGAGDIASDHLGAHFGANATAQPTTGVYDRACVHTVGILPGVFRIQCTAPAQPGTYHLRGHGRTVESGTTYDWWGPDQEFQVA